jgi:hypothetical protein
MPPRVAVVGILAFWLVTTGFTFYRDLWPRLFASGPPAVSIELADEARQNVPARWTMYRNGQKVGKLTTLMKYLDAEDGFLFTYHYTQLEFDQSGIKLVVPEATSEVRMTRSGAFKEETMSGKVEVRRGEETIVRGTIDVRGVVADGTLKGRCAVKSTFGNVETDLDPVPVPRTGQPLNPLQPVNRLSVRGGQDWVVHESNPLEEAVAGLVRKQLATWGVRLPDEKAKDALVARVSATPQPLTWQRAEVACWVIEYRRAEPVARTWVRASDGKVLRQEAFEKGENLTFERED